MTYRLLRLREELSHPPSIQLYRSTYRFNALQQDRTTSLEKVARGPINTLDVELNQARYLLAGSADTTIHIYDLESSSRIRNPARPENTGVCRPIATMERRSAHRYSVTGVRWFPFDTGLFTTSSMDGTVKVWDTNAMQNACTFDIENHVYAHDISHVATSHNLIASGTEAAPVRLCDLRTGAFTHSLQGHHGSILTVKWSPRDEFLLASGSSDHTVRFWDIRKARSCVLTLDQHDTSGNASLRTEDASDQSVSAHDGAVNALTFTSDGLHLVSTGHDEAIRLWDVFTGKNTLTNYGPHLRNTVLHEVQPAITALDSCSPPLLFHPSDNRQILVFDLWSGELKARLKRHLGRVACVALRPGYEVIYTGGNDNEIIHWTPANHDTG